jgi:hypothetical protein
MSALAVPVVGGKTIDTANQTSVGSKLVVGFLCLSPCAAPPGECLACWTPASTWRALQGK